MIISGKIVKEGSHPTFLASAKHSSLPQSLEEQQRVFAEEKEATEEMLVCSNNIRGVNHTSWLISAHV